MNGVGFRAKVTVKTPLAAIVSLCGLLESDYDGPRDSATREHLALLTESGLRSAAIVDALLLLASTTNTRAIPIRSLAMETVVDAIPRRLHSLIERHQARIVVPERWPAADGYGPWVEEVWANYVSNAISYGGPRPTVTLGADPPAGGFVRFWVRDEGPGLSAAQQARLFTPFTRLHLDQAPGHGLGLSIVQRIVTRLGGAVGVESAPGAGSRFFFTLPATAVLASDPTPQPRLTSSR